MFFGGLLSVVQFKMELQKASNGHHDLSPDRIPENGYVSTTTQEEQSQKKVTALKVQKFYMTSYLLICNLFVLKAKLCLKDRDLKLRC